MRPGMVRASGASHLDAQKNQREGGAPGRCSGVTLQSASLSDLEAELNCAQEDADAAYRIDFCFHDGFVSFLDLYETLEKLLPVAIKLADHFSVELAGLPFGLQGLFQQFKLDNQFSGLRFYGFSQVLQALVDGFFAGNRGPQLLHVDLACFLPARRGDPAST